MYRGQLGQIHHIHLKKVKYRGGRENCVRSTILMYADIIEGPSLTLEYQQGNLDTLRRGIEHLQFSWRPLDYCLT